MSQSSLTRNGLSTIRMSVVEVIVSGYNALLTGLAILAGVIVGVAFVLIVVDVLIRAAGFKPPAYTVAVVEYGLLYFTLLSAPYLVRQKRHVFVGALTERLPNRFRRVLAKLVYLLCSLSSLLAAYLGWILLHSAFMSGNLDMRSINISYWILYAPIPICFFLISCEFARYLIGVDDMYVSRTEVESL